MLTSSCAPVLKHLLILSLFGLGAVITGSAAKLDPVSLAGTWRFQLDRQDAGVSERWFERALPARIKLPGGLTEQGVGDPPSIDTKWVGDVQHPWYKEPGLVKYAQPGNFKFPYWLTPDLYYSGPAWFQRDITIPSHWQGQRVVLSLERTHWGTQVWLDNRLVGTNTSLSTAHEYDLGTTLAPGKHQLTIRVDNRIIVDVGINSHSISDHTQGNWNGVVGNISMRATSPVYIADLQVYPSLKERRVQVKGTVGNAGGKSGAGKLTLAVGPEGKPKVSLGNTKIDVSWNVEGGRFQADVPVTGDLKTWDEFSPALYRATASLEGANADDRRERTFGFRDLSTDGTQFVLNGHKIFFRGTLECCIFPKTGHPPTDVASWKRILGVARAYGLNMLRFHSWCPPEAAFLAADEMGFYYQVEIASWANQSTTLGDGKPVDQWLYEEAGRILKAYGNHPSFMLMPYGNEPGGKNATPFLAKWVDHWKAADSRRLYTSGAGWPQIAENQFHVTPDPRIQRWGQGLKSRINGRPPETTTDYRDYIRERTVPVISHEIGQWCVYPNFAEIPKYTGYLKPRNFEIFHDSLNAHHMENLSRLFLLASGKLQTLCYKEDIESALRTPGMGGFQLLDLHDFPGQGTALVGVLDPFWDDKGYVTAAEYSRFCNSVVPLARLSKRVFTTGESLTADLEIANFSAAPFRNAQLDWKLVGEDGSTWDAGSVKRDEIPIDNGVALGKIAASFAKAHAPAKGKLVTRLKGTKFENDWDVWVYPAQVALEAGPDIVIAEGLTPEVAARLERGGKVLLTIPPAVVRPDPKLGKVALGFSSIFWNTAWTRRQPPHTLGIYCEPKHPLFAEFPTEFHSNWQWYYLVSRAVAMILDELPPQLRPLVGVIDDWVTNRRLGLVFEAKVGDGKLVVCSIDLEHDLEADPVRKQFRHSLLNYMAGKKFAPSQELSLQEVRELYRQPSEKAKLVSGIRVDSEENGNEAENAIDGNPETFWHTEYQDARPEFPHFVQIELKQPTRLRGITVLPRQDGNPNGSIKAYKVFVSDNGADWGSPIANGVFPAGAELKSVEFAPRTCRYVKLVALSGHRNGPWASVAELALVPDSEK